MKKALGSLIIGSSICFSANLVFAGEREDLMARMGFSKEEIARDKQRHDALAKKLDKIAPKNDSKPAEVALQDAVQIDQKRSENAAVQKALALAAEAETKAAEAEQRKEEAWQKYNGASSTASKLSGVAYDEGRKLVNQLWHEYEKSMDESSAAARKAAEAKAAADRVSAAHDQKLR